MRISRSALCGDRPFNYKLLLFAGGFKSFLITKSTKSTKKCKQVPLFEEIFMFFRAFRVFRDQKIFSLFQSSEREVKRNRREKRKGCCQLRFAVFNSPFFIYILQCSLAAGVGNLHKVCEWNRLRQGRRLFLRRGPSWWR